LVDELEAMVRLKVAEKQAAEKRAAEPQVITLRGLNN
jgi:hypothetical protein